MKTLCFSKDKSGSSLLVVVFGILVSCSNQLPAEKAESSVQKMGLNGKVKSMTEIVYKAYDLSMTSKEKVIQSKSVQFFNKNGNSVEDNYFLSDGKLNSKSTYVYNKKGLLIERLFLNDEENLVYKIVYEYGKNGQLVKMDYLNYEGNSEYSVTSKYDNKGNEIEKNTYKSDKSLGMIALFYDEEGNLKKDFHKPFESKSEKILFKYDDRGNILDEIHYSQDGSLAVRYIYNFDEKGNKIETNIYNSSDKIISRSIYKYDEKGNMIGAYDVESDSTINLVNDKKYDEKGNIVEEIADYGQRKSRVTHKYDSQDKFGNWLLKTTTETSLSDNEKVVLKIIFERGIEYY